METQRLLALTRLGVLDTPPTAELDSITALTAQICDTPIAFISLVDKSRVWIKSKVGTPLSELPRELSFCTQTISQADITVVENASDARFTQALSNFRFYAGAPLATRSGDKIGALCVVDRQTRTLSGLQRQTLKTLASQIIVNFENSLSSPASQAREVPLGHFASIVQMLPDLVSRMDTQYRYTFLNLAYEKAFNLNSANSVGRTLSEILGTEAFTLLKPYVDLALNGEPQNFQISLPISFAGCLRRRIFQVRYQPDIEPDGKISGVFTVVTDLTELKEAEESARDRGRKLEELLDYQKAILQNVPSMIYVKDASKELRYNYINLAGEKILGLKENEILGKLDADLFPAAQAAQIMRDDLDVFKRGKVVETEREEFVTRLGKRFFRSYKVPTFDEGGKPRLLIGISRDITEEMTIRNELEIARMKAVHGAKMASIGEISAGVAHEVNNPLAIIAGSVEILAKVKDQPEKFQAKIESIHKSVSRIAKIVNNLRRFSRYNESRTFENHCLAAVVNEAFEMAEAKARYHSVAVELNTACQAVIYCCPPELEQVIVNLLNNAVDAIKAEQTKWIKVDILDSTDTIILRVIDSGPGIPAAIEEKLFLPFFTTKPIGEGTGLGLSISREILDRHHASISINHDFQTTCFEINFPRLSAQT